MMISESLTPGQSGALVVLGERRNRSQGGSDERKLPAFVKGRGGASGPWRIALLHRQNASSHLSTWDFVSLGEVCVMYSEVSVARQFMCLVG